MKKHLSFLFLLILLGFLCSCGNQSDKYASFEKEAAWGQGEKLVFFNIDTQKYSTQYATEATRAAEPEEVGGVVAYTSSGEPDMIVLTLTDPVGQEDVAKTTVNKKDLDSGEAGEWAAREWQDYLIHREIKALIQNKKANGDKYAVAVTKTIDGNETIRFTLSSDRIPADQLAKSPAEVGFVVDIEAADWDEPDRVYVSLYDANLYDNMFRGHTFDESELPSGKAFRRFLNSKSDYTRFRSFAGKKTLMGNGDKLICQDSYWTQLFSGDHIPSDLLASTPEEVGLIVHLLEYTSERTVTYSSSLSFGSITLPSANREVTGNVEVLSVELINPSDGSLFYEEILQADPPEKIQEQDTFYAELDPAVVESFMRKQAEIFLYDRRVRSMVEEGPMGGKSVVVFDGGRGQYVPRGSFVLADTDEQVGAVLVITKEKNRYEYEDYTSSGSLSKRHVMLRLEVLTLELRDLATGKTVASETLTAPVPYYVTVNANNEANISISEKTLEEWVASKWK